MQELELTYDVYGYQDVWTRLLTIDVVALCPVSVLPQISIALKFNGPNR